MITASIRLYNEEIYIFTQVIRSSSIRHAFLSGATDVVCVEQMKLSALALGCISQGISTLASNLLTTLTPSFDDHAPWTWTREYFDGCSNEIYEIVAPDALVGMR